MRKNKPKKKKSVKVPQSLSRTTRAQQQTDKVKKQLIALVDTRVSLLENNVKRSLDTLFNNQMSLQSAAKEAEDHILMLRRVLSDALGGTTRVHRIHLPPDLITERNDQIIDWDWYYTQLAVSENPAEFMDGLRIYTDKEVQRGLNKKHLDRILREVNGKLKAVEAQVAKPVNEGDPVPDLSEEVKKFLDKTKLVAQLAKEALACVDQGKDAEAQELMQKLREMVEVEEREAQQQKQQKIQKPFVEPKPSEPPVQKESAYPEGAVIFGGDVNA